MNTGNVVLTIIVILFVLVISFAIYKGVQQDKIKTAAVATGIPVPVATAIANSSDPKAAAKLIGVPDDIADSISQGVAVNLQ